MDARILKPGDEAVLAAAALTDEGVVVSLDRCRMLLADPGFVAAAAFDGDPVGLAYGHVLKQMTGDALLLYSLGVAEGHRRKGAATAMIEALKTVCVARGLYEMWVLTYGSNGPAMRLYAKTGGIRENDDDVMFVFPGASKS